MCAEGKMSMLHPLLPIISNDQKDQSFKTKQNKNRMENKKVPAAQEMVEAKKQGDPKPQAGWTGRFHIQPSTQQTDDTVLLGPTSNSEWPRLRQGRPHLLQGKERHGASFLPCTCSAVFVFSSVQWS